MQAHAWRHPGHSQVAPCSQPHSPLMKPPHDLECDGEYVLGRREVLSDSHGVREDERVSLLPIRTPKARRPRAEPR